MSLLLAGLVFASTSGAVMVGRWLKRRRDDLAPGAADGGAPKPATTADKSADEGEDAFDREARKEVEDEVPTPKDESSGKLVADAQEDDKAKPAAKEAGKGRGSKKGERKLEGPTAPLDAFICKLGDVVMRLTGEEAWLAGAVVLSEQVPVAVLFVAPDAGHDEMIWVRARPNKNIVWIEPLDPKAILVGGDPPSSVEHGGVRFERERRLPLRPRRLGVGAPDLGDAVIVAEYTSSGSERLLVLKANSGNVFAYRGLELEEGSFEVIASGDSTL